MPRRRKTDPDQALTAAALLFWREGYHAVGTRQIEAETGVTRFTLQTAYGGKMPLFLKALDHYLDRFEATLAPRMTDGRLETLARWFEANVPPEDLAPGAPFGCLMVNSICEFDGGDAGVSARAERFFTMLRQGFGEALAAIERNGAMAPGLDIEARTQLLTACAVSMNIAMRAGSAGGDPAAIARAAAVMVRSWAPADCGPHI
ncbi:TetR/AcrR family transcriptional regulator [Roseibium aggregatum]|uniref:TetR/AcrR family transcriptional regulator n=1 Tax=Roseibium aggregatum TaxID=187304 RepID=A0A926NYB2_9HYPH|nr:TetR/AcrR family transcriptional regulator [Roseibium aggregatum]MBD1549642.1 TetR/AcrR family transcriptional regulator [Roseibium aggregatum]